MAMHSVTSTGAAPVPDVAAVSQSSEVDSLINIIIIIHDCFIYGFNRCLM